MVAATDLNIHRPPRQSPLIHLDDADSICHAVGFIMNEQWRGAEHVIGVQCQGLPGRYGQ